MYSIEMERGEVLTDLYYLCEVDHRWFIVFETDFFDSFEEVLKEARDIFESDDFKITRWLLKKEGEQELTTSLDDIKNESVRGRPVLTRMGRYFETHIVVMEAEAMGEPRPHYSPEAYGGAS